MRVLFNRECNFKDSLAARAERIEPFPECTGAGKNDLSIKSRNQ